MKVQEKLTISREDVENTLKNREIVLSDYVCKEKHLDELFTTHHRNTRYDVVLQKVDLLKRAYNAGRFGSEAMARHIVEDIPNVDKLIAKGDPTVVHRIAKLNDTYFSFATKYCSFHNPAKYPIYDSWVYDVFSKLRKELTDKPFSKETIKNTEWSEKQKSPCGYELYKEIYDSFIKRYAANFENKDYRTIDHYLWSSRKMDRPEGKSVKNALNRFMHETK